MKTEGVINYTGNKSKLIPHLNEVFSKSNATRLIDVCCGGLSVTLHSHFKEVIANDINFKLIHMYNCLLHSDYETVVSKLNQLISHYGLSKTNEQAYYRLREDLNEAFTQKSPDRGFLLYLIHCYSFSNMIRFNQHGKFNVAFGKREFNSSIDDKLKDFYRIKEEKEIQFGFRNFLKIEAHSGDLVYIDPPYLITSAAYNSVWTEREDYAMMAWLDDINSRGIDFVMSNVFHHRGKSNDALIEWAKKYNVIAKDHKYVFNSYQAKGQEKETTEVIITNIKL